MIALMILLATRVSLTISWLRSSKVNAARNKVSSVKHVLPFVYSNVSIALTTIMVPMLIGKRKS